MINHHADYDQENHDSYHDHHDFFHTLSSNIMTMIMLIIILSYHYSKKLARYQNVIDCYHIQAMI